MASGSVSDSGVQPRSRTSQVALLAVHDAVASAQCYGMGHPERQPARAPAWALATVDGKHQENFSVDLMRNIRSALLPIFNLHALQSGSPQQR